MLLLGAKYSLYSLQQNLVVDAYGDSPLHQAVWLGSTSCVMALLQGGAGVNVLTTQGHSPLDLALGSPTMVV